MTTRTYLRSYHVLSALLFSLLCVINQHGFAQRNTGPGVSAQVIDSSSAAPLASSTVQVFRQGEKAVFRTVVADSAGRFSVALIAGNFHLSIKHLGYTLYISKPFSLISDQSVDLGIIRLQPVSKTLDEVVVQA
ncbi:MAG TPA: carboxypeptidase regulatory-like domain-containing protein, partial [Flavitalea sp.]|nr:carboxypeptidase regulatory-like domain-containing protein [Flavitalea sp.]